ncbi:putative RNA-binding protein [Neolecta irregularis DAH-3]|uniref:Putative RNA-binding protein n=1 Tax=Neolecta irregularis (strain DAH-3) TaxID=1198029 RepID=A0A1U7LIJ2_NEOID|nr:putative RNA-binding protein [Neolecta irregularis DAH-3]|eukprot:OLL22464.1 putative RNA-binding protein [Neolecta irregularis DAH-3]
METLILIQYLYKQEIALYPLGRNLHPKKRDSSYSSVYHIPANLTPGNLSYKITTEILSSHFSSVGTLLSVRLPYTQTSAPRPKGYAFIEYKDSLSLAKALKLHHTVLHDRKINVELTGGGGGNSIARKSKLKIKNSRLNMQRKKRIQSENVPEMIHPSRISRVKM